MNYIELINQFWQCDIEHSFNGSETRLYFYLLHTCNSLRWKNPFTHSDAHLAASSGMTVNTLKTARNRLKQAGLLEFTPGSQGRGQSHKAAYKLSIFDTIPDTLSANSLTLLARTADSIYKHKLNEETSTADADPPTSVLDAASPCQPTVSPTTPPPAKPPARPRQPKADANEIAELVAALPLPYPSDEFAQLWATFRTGSQHGKKALSAFEMMLKKLGKYPEGFAIVMLEAAIQGGWSGIENAGTARSYAEWQAEQARKPVPTAPPAPTVLDPDALFGYTQSAAKGLAQARQDPAYQRYLAEEAARLAEATAHQPAEADLSLAA